MEYIIGIIALLGGGLFFFRNKAKSAEALLENEPTKKQVNELSKETTVLEGKLEIEQERRDAIQADTERRKGEEVTNEELVKFIDALGRKSK